MFVVMKKWSTGNTENEALVSIEYEVEKDAYTKAENLQCEQNLPHVAFVVKRI